MNSFTFFKSYYDVLRYLKDEDRLKIYDCIFKYMFDDENVEIDGFLLGVWNLLSMSLTTSKIKSEQRRKKNEKETEEKRNENEMISEEKRNENNKNNHILIHNHNSYITNHNSNINNQDNINNSNNLEKIEYEEEEPLKADDTGLLAETFKEVISYLNLKTGSNYRYNTNSTTTRIKARLNEGFKLDDFIDVIDKKCADWLNTDMEKYLRPETLFGTKFESYLNQPTRPKKLKDISFEELEEMSKWEKQNF